MLPLLLNSVCSRKPIVLVPGTYASNLEFELKDVSLSWYCPKNKKPTIMWMNEAYLIPPVIECLFQWATVKYDHETGKQKNLKGVTINTVDFGGLSGINRLDKTVLNMSFVPYFSRMVDKFKEAGYLERIDLFGAPNDWRLGLAGQDDFLERLKELVEHAYKMNSNEKVVLIGHSFGGYLAHHFANSYSGKAWAEKYIDSIILIAPSFGGSGQSIDVAWSRTVRQFIPIKLNHLGDLVESAGAVHIHFPNYELYGNKTIVTGPDGTQYASKDIPDLLINHGKIRGDNIKLLEKNIPYISKMPAQPVIPTKILYNSKQATPFGMKISGKWDNGKIETIEAGGDGTVLSEGVESYCKKAANSNLSCTDILMSGKGGGHFMMMLDKSVINRVYQLINNP